MLRHLDNEYQDPISLGSLVGAREAWITLVTAGEHALAQRLRFHVACPTELLADQLAAVLEQTTGASAAAVRGRGTAGPHDAWQVRGCTPHQIQSLEDLEHLFTSIRRAAKAHDSELVALHLYPRAA